MRADDIQSELLIRLLRERGWGPHVMHLPYTSDFELICSELIGNATTDDKRKVWERIVELEPSLRAEPKEIPSAPEPDLSRDEMHRTSPVPRLVRSPDFRDSLFEDSVKTAVMQPWTVPAHEALSAELEEKRQKLLSEVANSRLGTTEQRVAYLLQRFPETRDSDTALCIQYWKRFQANIVEEWDPLELEILFELERIETIGRIRRYIQNDLHLFRGSREGNRNRDQFQRELHEYLASSASTAPEIRFYLDETGNEGDKTLVGIGGVCIINWKQYEKHHAAVAQWRRAQAWPEPIHFSETGNDRLDRAIALLGELEKRRAGLLFLGYSLSSRGRTHEDTYSLLVQLVTDALHNLKGQGCLQQPTSLRIIKEADPGFDNLYLQKMHKQLSELVAGDFPGQVVVREIEPLAKGRDVFLECADLIAGGMQRRALMKGWNPKDKLAAAIMNVTGFEDPRDEGALYKYYPSFTTRGR